MRKLKQIAKYDRHNHQDIPKIEWEFFNWYKNCFEYRNGNRLLTIRDYDYRDSYNKTMDSFLITMDDKTVIKEYEILEGDPLYVKPL